MISLTKVFANTLYSSCASFVRHWISIPAINSAYIVTPDRYDWPVKSAFLRTNDSQVVIILLMTIHRRDKKFFTFQIFQTHSWLRYKGWKRALFRFYLSIRSRIFVGIGLRFNGTNRSVKREAARNTTRRERKNGFSSPRLLCRFTRSRR